MTNETDITSGGTWNKGMIAKSTPSKSLAVYVTTYLQLNCSSRLTNK